MQKLVISALALAGMASVAMAEEAVKLTPSQMDEVSAGACLGVLACGQLQFQPQVAIAGQFAAGGCNLLACNGGLASAANGNATNVGNVASNVGTQIQ